ncbi:hypothetical protein CFREI_04470 [Corynebacterium freiburgense]|nr:hypothetical protein CFREI_04470 [Corynebacterium freiburgense]
MAGVSSVTFGARGVVVARIPLFQPGELVLSGASWALVGRVVTDSIFSADFMESVTR